MDLIEWGFEEGSETGRPSQTTQYGQPNQREIKTICCPCCCLWWRYLFYPSVHLSTLHLSISISIHPSIHPSISILSSVYPSIYHLSISVFYPASHLHLLCLSMYLVFNYTSILRHLYCFKNFTVVVRKKNCK